MHVQNERGLGSKMRQSERSVRENGSKSTSDVLHFNVEFTAQFAKTLQALSNPQPIAPATTVSARPLQSPTKEQRIAALEQEVTKLVAILAQLIAAKQAAAVH